MKDRTAWRWAFLGWLTFVASAIVFIVAALRAGDVLSLIASVLFLVACVFFMIPSWVHRPRK